VEEQEVALQVETSRDAPHTGHTLQ